MTTHVKNSEVGFCRSGAEMREIVAGIKISYGYLMLKDRGGYMMEDNTAVF